TDIYLQRSRKYPDIPNEWVLEIKYVKKSDRKNAAVLKSKRIEAREQLERYRNSHLFKDRTDVRYLTIIFIGKDKTEITENGR
ncbi:MAG: PD-(D/E)XK nuclease domain-containing protein, partial [Tannerella sp.]|nr:PD-(D/E)XK nuclease domain-containing protein [Tannerella sp.]